MTALIVDRLPEGDDWMYEVKPHSWVFDETSLPGKFGVKDSSQPTTPASRRRREGGFTETFRARARRFVEHAIEELMPLLVTDAQDVRPPSPRK